MTTERYTVEIIQRTGVNGLAYVYDNEARHNERVATGPDAVRLAEEMAARLNSNGDINKQAILSKRIDSLMDSGVTFDPEAGASAPDANRHRVQTGGLPDPAVTGPCQVQATFLCTQVAAGERLIPTSMLPDALIPGPLYAPMCLACYEHLSTVYLSTLHPST